MLIIPAIDIIDGRCVRLKQGEYNSAVVYSDDPVETARTFESSGATRLHIVDLDAARGNGNNRRVLKEIRQAVSMVIEIGGGIRSDDDVSELLDLGMDRLILGTVLTKEPGILQRWTSMFGRCFIAGIDAKNDEVRTSGWISGSGIIAAELAKTAAEDGALSIIYTNIEKDGTLAGPDLEGTVKIARMSGLSVILSGGIGSLSDLREIYNRKDSGISGIITGKALYEGRFDLSEAIELFQNSHEVVQEW